MINKSTHLNRIIIAIILCFLPCYARAQSKAPAITIEVSFKKPNSNDSIIDYGSPEKLRGATLPLFIQVKNVSGKDIDIFYNIDEPTISFDGKGTNAKLKPRETPVSAGLYPHHLKDGEVFITFVDLSKFLVLPSSRIFDVSFEVAMLCDTGDPGNTHDAFVRQKFLLHHTP